MALGCAVASGAIPLAGNASTPPGDPAAIAAARAIELRDLARNGLHPSELRQWLASVIDVGNVTDRLLGVHRDELADAERTEFDRLFIDILVARAWARPAALAEFESRCSADGPTRVRCELTRARDVAVVWLTLHGGRVVDARVGGVGLIESNRAQIDRVLRRSGVDGLLERMRRRAEAPGGPSASSSRR